MDEKIVLVVGDEYSFELYSKKIVKVKIVQIYDDIYVFKKVPYVRYVHKNFLSRLLLGVSEISASSFKERVLRAQGRFNHDSIEI